jgi:hypothetical protein
MKSTMINRSWPAEEEAEATAVHLQRDAERSRTQAALDLQRTIQNLELMAQVGDLSTGAHCKVTQAIAALRTAMRDQW